MNRLQKLRRALSGLIASLKAGITRVQIVLNSDRAPSGPNPYGLGKTAETYSETDDSALSIDWTRYDPIV